MNVIIVSNDELWAEKVSAAFSQKGLEVLSVPHDSAELEKLVKQVVPDVLVADCEQIEHDGTLWREALRRYSPLAETVVVGYPEEIVKNINVLRQGAFDCLPKSTQVEPLLEAVRFAGERKARSAERLERLTRKNNSTPA